MITTLMKIISSTKVFQWQKNHREPSIITLPGQTISGDPADTRMVMKVIIIVMDRIVFFWITCFCVCF